MSLFSQPGMLPGPCCFPQSLFSCSFPQEGLLHPQGAWWHLSSPRAAGGTRPLRGLLSSTIRHSPGFPQRDPSWSFGNPGDAGGRAHPIAAGHPLCLGVQCVGKGHQELLVPVLCAAPGSPSRCCCCCCCCLFHLPHLFLPRSSSLPVPVIHWHPWLCGLPAPGHSARHSPWHSAWQGFSPQLRGTPGQTRDPVVEGYNTPKPVTHPSAPAAGASSRANESSELTLIIISKLTSG